MTPPALPGFKTLPQFRITVNSRCERFCFFCRPSGEAVATPAGRELSLEDLVRVASVVRALGIPEAKLTGGDPALYEPLVEAVRRLKWDAGFTHVEVISRHPRIGDLAGDLASAGVDRFNLSLDTLDPNLHYEICGVNDLPEILGALDRVVGTGVPCKVNTVVMAGVNDHELGDLVRYCESAGVRAVKLLDVIKDLDAGQESYARRLLRRRHARLEDLYRPLSSILSELGFDASTARTEHQGGLGHPMSVLRLPSGLELIVKDHLAGAWYGSICSGCPFFPCHDALMALRLTADLRLQFCLLRQDITIDLAAALSERQAAVEAAVHGALRVYDSARFVEVVSAR